MGLGKWLWEVEEQCTSSEFSRWERYYRQEPFGARGDNLHAAMMCRQMWLVMVGKDRPLEDFMFREPDPPETQEQRYQRMHAAWHSIPLSPKKD